MHFFLEGPQINFPSKIFRCTWSCYESVGHVGVAVGHLGIEVEQLRLLFQIQQEQFKRNTILIFIHWQSQPFITMQLQHFGCNPVHWWLDSHSPLVLAVRYTTTHYLYTLMYMHNKVHACVYMPTYLQNADFHQTKPKNYKMFRLLCSPNEKRDVQEEYNFRYKFVTRTKSELEICQRYCLAKK